MQDAVILANHLYDMKPTSFETIKTALSDYKEERFDAIKEQYPQSYISAKLLYGHVSQPGMNLLYSIKGSCIFGIKLGWWALLLSSSSLLFLQKKKMAIEFFGARS